MNILDEYHVTFIVLHQPYKELTHELQFIGSFSSEVSLFLSSVFRQVRQQQDSSDHNRCI